MKTKITDESKELNNLIEHILKLLLKNKEITEKEYYLLREAIKKEHFPLKT